MNNQDKAQELARNNSGCLTRGSQKRSHLNLQICFTHKEMMVYLITACDGLARECS